MTDNHDDYIDEFQPDEPQLQKIVGLANEYIDVSTEIERIQSRLKVLEKQRDDLSNVMLPDAMHKINMTEFRLDNGYRLKVKPVLGCTLPKDNIDKAEVWLEDNGHSGLMKHQLVVSLGRNIDPQKFLRLVVTIRKEGFGYEDIKRIHPQTLLKWAREMEEGEEVIPTDIFNVYHGYKVEINT